MAVSDESIAILQMCNQNLRINVRKAVFDFFDDRLRGHINNLKSFTPKEKLPVRAQRALQEDLRNIKEGSARDHCALILRESLLSICPYLSELLQQITKFQIILLSKIRTGKDGAFDVCIPDINEFYSNIMCKNCCSIFHNVELYYKCFVRRNPTCFRDIVDGNTDAVLNEYMSRAYTTFFTPDSKCEPGKSPTLEDAICLAKLDGAPADDRPEVIVDTKSESAKSDPEQDVVKEITNDISDDEFLQKRVEDELLSQF